MTSSAGVGRSPIAVLSDADIAQTLDPARAVRWMREALLAADAGTLSGPARVGMPFPEGRVVFTVGAWKDNWFGYRSYDTFSTQFEGGRSDQVVVVQSAQTGLVQGVAIGNLLGQLRTGALGGAAVDLLSKPDAHSLGVIGSGAQAWGQAWAVSSVRELTSIRVHSPDPANAALFARRVESELGISCAATKTAQDAVRDRDLVVLATSSDSPVIEAAWLAPGTHVTTMGPKQVGRAEFGLDLLDWADVIATDSIAQLHAYDPPALGVDTSCARDVVSLGSVAASRTTRTTRTARTASELTDGVDRRTLYLSVGLAGSEVHLLHRLLATSTSGDGRGDRG